MKILLSIVWMMLQISMPASEKEQLIRSLERVMEASAAATDRLQVVLQEPTVQTDKGEPTDVDWLVSGYNIGDHFEEDMRTIGVADICTKHFPHYSLAEKNAHASDWSRQDWAAARLGDMFRSEIPANVYQRISQVYADADNYISAYNVMMNRVRGKKGEELWPEGTRLLTHWNLRDELKSNYAPLPNARTKQELIYQVMLHIINDDTPVEWLETDMGQRRYQTIIDNFHAVREMDAYDTLFATYIDRRFEGELEMPEAEVDKLFTQLVSSPEVKKVARLIRQQLGRPLRPYDIWYDGFKARSGMNEDDLTALTRSRYSNAKAYEEDIERMMRTMGFSAEEAAFVSSKITVDPARGSGHARPCVARTEPARLRTRIGQDGMDYKGYNIAVHEMGHNIEEVTSLYHMDYYMLHGIPNDGFTEASAFLWQQRDLMLLGLTPEAEGSSVASGMEKNEVLDQFWSMYEIMGVSLLDMRMWRWLYAHPDATAEDLKAAVLQLAAAVWNEFYYPVLGEKDCPLLAIYSHMVCYPLYLPGYPIGHLVQFQLEEHLSQCATKEDFAREYTRIYSQGRLTPDAWMKGAVGHSISVEPILRAVDRYTEKVKR